jgi:hypothetical protein
MPLLELLLRRSSEVSEPRGAMGIKGNAVASCDNKIVTVMMARLCNRGFVKRSLFIRLSVKYISIRVAVA